MYVCYVASNNTPASPVNVALSVCKVVARVGVISLLYHAYVTLRRNAGR